MKDLVKGDKVRRLHSKFQDIEVGKIYTFEAYDKEQITPSIFIKEYSLHSLDTSKFEKVETGLEDLSKTPPCVHQSPEEKEEVAQEIVKESPLSRVFDSGMKRDNDENKPYVHNLQGYTRLRFGYLTRMGARNYGDGNFLLGSPSEDALKSLDRHLAKFLDGDRSEDHLAAMIFNVQLVMLNEKREGMSADHYFKPENK
jgi:hypothetical protein